MIWFLLGFFLNSVNANSPTLLLQMNDFWRSNLKYKHTMMPVCIIFEFTYRYKQWWGKRYMSASPSVRSWGTVLDCCRCPPSDQCPIELEEEEIKSIRVYDKTRLKYIAVILWRSYAYDSGGKSRCELASQIHEYSTIIPFGIIDHSKKILILIWLNLFNKLNQISTHRLHNLHFIACYLTR